MPLPDPMRVFAGPYPAELELALDTARRAGALAQRAFTERGFDVEHKADNLGPVTTADRAANTLICEALLAGFPGDTLVAEESVDEAQWSPRTWLVDPIDGTRQFVEGVPEFAVMIALCVEGLPVLGVVFHPPTDTMTFAVRGHGAHTWLDRQLTTLQVCREHDPSRARIVRSRSHRSALIDQVCERLDITSHRHMGSLGLKLVEIASGRAEVYINTSGKASQWDAAAGHVIVCEAGGRVSLADGSPMRYRKGDVALSRGLVASNGPLHQQVIDAIASSGVT